MNFMRVIYFFCNGFFNGDFWAKGMHDGKILFFVFLLTFIVALAYNLYFYKKYTLANVCKTATTNNFYKFFMYGLITCFVLVIAVFATTTKNPNSNIFVPIFGKHGEMLVFSLINLIYFTVLYAVISYFMKSQSKNAKGIWFF